MLDLLDDDGRPSEVLERIRLAPESEYKQRLADWLTAAYADALVYVDPANDDEIAIRDAFRKYVPTGQQSRMVSLFMGLFIAAGVMPAKQQAERKRAVVAERPRTATLVKAPVAAKAFANGARQQNDAPIGGAIPPALAGLLTSLPRTETGWTVEQRDRFLATFGAVLDFCYPVGKPADPAADLC